MMGRILTVNDKHLSIVPFSGRHECTFELRAHLCLSRKQSTIESLFKDEIKKARQQFPTCDLLKNLNKQTLPLCRFDVDISQIESFAKTYADFIALHGNRTVTITLKYYYKINKIVLIASDELAVLLGQFRSLFKYKSCDISPFINKDEQRLFLYAEEKPYVYIEDNHTVYPITIEYKTTIKALVAHHTNRRQEQYDLTANDFSDLILPVKMHGLILANHSIFALTPSLTTEPQPAEKPAQNNHTFSS